MAKKRTSKQSSRSAKSGPGARKSSPKGRSKSSNRTGNRSRTATASVKKRPISRKRTRRQPIPDDSNVRLQKFLAEAGVGSRRDCELLIVEGRVEIDGTLVTKLGAKVDPETSKVTVDGERVRTERKRYFIINKPPGVVSTSKDPSGRIRVVDLISTHQRVYNVGRLDKSSQGLMLVTNDGYLAQRLTHPSFGVQKTYQVQVKGSPHLNELEVLKRGVHLAEGVAKVKDVKVRRRQKNSTDLELVLDEGKNREIRRLLAKLGHKVVKLTRVAIGPLQMGDLKQGAHRKLTDLEVEALKKAVEIGQKGGAANSKTRSRPIGFDQFQKEKEERILQWSEKKQKQKGKRPQKSTRERVETAGEQSEDKSTDRFPAKRKSGRPSSIPRPGSRKGIGRPSRSKRMAVASGGPSAGGRATNSGRTAGKPAGSKSRGASASSRSGSASKMKSGSKGRSAGSGRPTKGRRR